MKIRQCVAASVAVMMALCLFNPALAQQAEESMNLFKSVGKKQTAKDFKPAPDKMETNFGNLEFEGGSFPTEASTQKIYDEMDRQRATQAYMDFYPSLSLYSIVKSQIRDFGFKSASDVGVMADFMTTN